MTEKKRWRRQGRKKRRKNRGGKNIRERKEWRVPLKESNVLCTPRKHMALLLTQRATPSQLKYVLQKEVKNTAGFWETVPDLK